MMNSQSDSKTRINKKILALLLIVFAAILYFLYRTSSLNFYSKYPELNKINNKNLDFKELSVFFKDLALKKGAQYAFNALNVAKLPPNTDFHLLGHAVGDVLYKQQGLQGIKICTQDFRNSCSHSIVVGLFVDRGVEALSDISEVCRNAPGGAGAYGMCFHGLGHGILAFTGYDMKKAVDLCKKTGTERLNNVEISECIGGVTMEMVAGVHDEKAWLQQKDKYLKKSDPLFPCNQPFIPAIAKPNCYMYLTPHLWQVAGGDLASPKEEDFKKAFNYCEKITDDIGNKKVCYGSFGKEFVGLAMSRDIRNISEINDTQLTQVYNWCLLASNQFGVVSCIQTAVNSLYWGGENKPIASINFCRVMSDEHYKSVCYEHVLGGFKYYNLRSPSKLYGLCRLLPDEYKNKCLDQNYYEKID